MPEESYTTLKVTRPREYVVRVELNRPSSLNAMNIAFWREIKRCFNDLNTDPDCRVVVLSGAGRIFTAGLDLKEITSTSPVSPDGPALDLDVSRIAFRNRQTIKDWQDSFTAIEKCNKPVIAAIHSACVGGGVDMTSACDIRYCTEDAWFQIKEIELGLVADVGTLQRFPKIIGNDSQARELALTARRFNSKEAKEIGFVSRILPDRERLIEAALDTASLIASKSPVAVCGTKISMLYSRDHSVADGLDQVCDWNQAMVQSEDIMEAIPAALARKPAKFSKL